jgi:hypothetical protein
MWHNWSANQGNHDLVRRGEVKKFNKFFTKLAFKRAVYAYHTINMNPSFYPLVLHSKGVGQLSFLFLVRSTSLLESTLLAFFLFASSSISNCKIDICPKGAYYNKKCMTSNDQRLPLP